VNKTKANICELGKRQSFVTGGKTSILDNLAPLLFMLS